MDFYDFLFYFRLLIFSHFINLIPCRLNFFLTFPKSFIIHLKLIVLLIIYLPLIEHPNLPPGNRCFFLLNHQDNLHSFRSQLNFILTALAELINYQFKVEVTVSSVNYGWLKLSNLFNCYQFCSIMKYHFHFILSLEFWSIILIFFIVVALVSYFIQLLYRSQFRILFNLK